MKKVFLWLGGFAALATILTFLRPFFPNRQNEQRTFTGAVHNISTGMPISGANASVSDDGHMTQNFSTDQNGVFSFRVQRTQHSLSIYVTAAGYKPASINANPEREGIEPIEMTPLPSGAQVSAPAEVESSARFASQTTKEAETRRLERMYMSVHPDSTDIAALNHFVNKHLAQEGAGFTVKLTSSTTASHNLMVGGGIRVSGYGNHVVGNTVNNYPQAEKSPN